MFLKLLQNTFKKSSKFKLPRYIMYVLFQSDYEYSFIYGYKMYNMINIYYVTIYIIPITYLYLQNNTRKYLY